MSATDVGQFVALDPPQVITFVTGENMGHLEIANTSPTKNIAFKIRTTQPLCYVVKPNAGIIEAMGKIKAEINFVPNEAVKNADQSKFQVQFAYTELKSTETDQLANLYSMLTKQQI
mmetsp:Transcript_37677/g.45845  ORF Transcript_37677/g.45845 Transcript_37677/m.45845 type:complete len:117 (+) Transcript_37677:89-439(+)